MVRFIYDSVVGVIDGFLSQADPAMNRSDFNGAETARLAFKVNVSGVSGRLTRLASGLAPISSFDLPTLARVPVTLDEPV